MVAILTAVGAFIAGVIPALLSVRWSKAARLRRKLEADFALIEKAPQDSVTRENLLALVRHESGMLRINESAPGPHPLTLFAITYSVVGGLSIGLARVIALTEESDPFVRVFGFGGLIILCLGFLFGTLRFMSYLLRNNSLHSAHRRLRERQIEKFASTDSDRVNE